MGPRRTSQGMGLSEIHSNTELQDRSRMLFHVAESAYNTLRADIINAHDDASNVPDGFDETV